MNAIPAFDPALPAFVHDAEGLEYAIAHDLRTPLRAVAMTAGVLLEEIGDGLSAEHRRLLERQAMNAVRFGRLVDDLLELSRLGRARVARTRVDVTALARSHGGRVEAAAGMAVDADPRLAATLLGCLIDNALKFSTGPVHVRQAGDVMRVEDGGLGIAAAHARRLFRPFERGVGEETPGTGAGLAKAARIVARHGGRIWIESAPGRGTTVAFTLAEGLDAA